MKQKLLATLRELAALSRSAALAALVALGIAGMGIGPIAATTLTLTPTNTLAPRYYPEQLTHYVRFAVDFNDCPLRAADTACSLRVATLPYNAFLVSISKQIITTFNPTTSATIALGTSGQATNVMAAFNVFTGQSTAAAFDTGFAGAGELVTGSGATQTGANGGFDIYATYTVGAAGSQGTQGRAIFIIQYIAPNDGDCVAVPAGATATSC
ncbi:hypothetical protein PMI42_01724 [Bradyrhizobium sp. YR681]|uniref:hypothetical protein n=1 Tax=Bradyrhizobium sp. YR681 TaxID=1144344 RepID=UPI0002712A5E|nr:hypothetical protein [Bradyrhizobium sp. YR681]EJN14750.1 hypothetical protein PMI42_01724 [Bradyrhizobium sp. YR681]